MRRVFACARVAVALVSSGAACKRAPSPAVVVDVTWPGASVGVVESHLTIPLENALAGVGLSPQLERETSTSRAGAARVRVQDDVVAALRASLAPAPLPEGVRVIVERGCAH